MKLKKVVEFEIDDKIAESIIKLNNKGYKTAMCCSGHPDEEEIIPYVMFTKFVSYGIEYIPCSWVIDKRFKELVIRRFFDDEEKKIFKKEQLIDIAARELYNWVYTLPNFKNPYQNIIEMEVI